MTLSLKPLPRWVITLWRSMAGFMVLALHFELLSDANWTRRAVCTLPLIILPAVLGSYLNLKEHGRWLTYYVIWIQLMTSSFENYIRAPVWDVFFFLSIDTTYRCHLRALVGDKTIPLRVYFSSWISDDSKLSAFIAAHKTLDSNNNNNNNNTATTNNNINNDDDDKKRDDHSGQQQADIHTATTVTTKTKWVYALVIGALILNTYLVVSVKYWDYNCSRMAYAFDALTTHDVREEYRIYCFPPSWRYVFRFTFLKWPHPESLFAIVTAYFCAAAWSTLPTKIIIRAWIRMWSNNSSNDGNGDRMKNKLFTIRKVHYFLFLYLPKGLAYIQIEYMSTLPWDDPEISNRERYLFLGAVVFCYASSLVFALVLLWNLYVVHSGLDACQDQQQLLLQGGGFECQEKVGGRGDAGGVSESEKKPFLDNEVPSIHVIDMSPTSY